MGVGAYLSLSGSGREVGWGGRLLTFSAFRVGANSRLGAYSNKYGKWQSIRSTEHLRSGPFVRFIYLFIFSCLICSLSLFPVVLEIQSLVTVLQHVFRNPFILVMSALRCHCCYGSVEASKINLKPWIFIVFFS